ncbi:MAG TPA: hypothetical protein VFI68_12995 [Anaerolineales bacterium]|nr:hypothetical protein [Anaerolineales bacterium]
MKPLFKFWILRRAQYTAIGLVTALALSSCAPAVLTATNLPKEVSTLQVLPATAVPVDPATPEATVVEPVQAIATSRGPNLEATDPSTVDLAAGQLQLIEFFRFT